MRYAARAARWVRENRPADYARICAKRAFDEAAGDGVWHRIAEQHVSLVRTGAGHFLQQDGYLDKEQTLVADLDGRAPHQSKWSWDRILRSCFHQAGGRVARGLFLRRGVRLTRSTAISTSTNRAPVHESSLSPASMPSLPRASATEKASKCTCARRGWTLDDYNREVAGGCHVTSMAGRGSRWSRVSGACASATACCRSIRGCLRRVESLSFRSLSGRVLTVKVTSTAVEVLKRGRSVESLSAAAASSWRKK